MKLEASLINILQVVLLSSAGIVSAENIDPYDDGSQYAYGENIGWINFEPNKPEPNVGATVSDNKLTGFVYAENIGWIHFRSIYIVDFDMFANFAVEWRETEVGLEADLYEDGNVNWQDLRIFTDYWLDECPADWGLCPPSYKVKTSWTAGL